MSSSSIRQFAFAEISYMKKRILFYMLIVLSISLLYLKFLLKASSLADIDVNMTPFILDQCYSLFVSLSFSICLGLTSSCIIRPDRVEKRRYLQFIISRNTNTIFFGQILRPLIIQLSIFSLWLILGFTLSFWDVNPPPFYKLLAMMLAANAFSNFYYALYLFLGTSKAKMAIVFLLLGLLGYVMQTPELSDLAITWYKTGAATALGCVEIAAVSLIMGALSWLAFKYQKNFIL